MSLHRHGPWIAASAGAVVVLVAGWLSDIRERPERSEVQALLLRIESECNPDSPANNYEWSSNAPPTEKHRREILERLHELREAAADEVRVRLLKKRIDEFGEMLVVIAAAMGDETKIIPAAKLMAYSEHPAVRLSAARELMKLRDSRTVEWFEYAACNDDRRVRNDGCGRTAEYYYPVRTVAVLALKDMGVEFKSPEQLAKDQRAREYEKLRAMHLRIMEAHRQREATPPPPPSAPEGTVRPPAR
jgi:hypothetical protein